MKVCNEYPITYCICLEVFWATYNVFSLTQFSAEVYGNVRKTQFFVSMQVTLTTLGDMVKYAQCMFRVNAWNNGIRSCRKSDIWFEHVDISVNTKQVKGFMTLLTSFQRHWRTSGGGWMRISRNWESFKDCLFRNRTLYIGLHPIHLQRFDQCPSTNHLGNYIPTI